MDAHVLAGLSRQVKDFIELLVLASSLHKRKNAFHEGIAIHPAEETEGPDEECICQPCLDILSRTHSAGAARYRHHEQDFVHHWLSDSKDTDAAVISAREVSLSGFKEEYLNRLEEQWLRHEKKLEPDSRFDH